MSSPASSSLVFVLASIALTGCAAGANGGSGNVTTKARSPVATASQPRPAADFSRIELRGPIDVVVREGRASSVAVTADQAYQGAIKTTVEGDTLVIDYDAPSHFCIGFCRSADDDTEVVVELPSVRSIKIEGAGDVTVEGAGPHAELDFVIEGSGDLRYSGNADLVRCRIDGSGDIVLRGSGKRLEARVEGSGDIKARDFPVEGGLYDLEGSGDVITDLHGGETSIHLHGSGDLLYSGEARITSLEVSGSGEVRQR